MLTRRFLKIGSIIGSVTVAAYYRQEVQDSYISFVRFGRTALTVIQLMVYLQQEIDLLC